jgi:hypothetical protein
VRTQKNSAASKVDKEFISHPTRPQHTLSAAETLSVSHALPAVCFLFLLRGRITSFQDGVAAGEGFLFACVINVLFGNDSIAIQKRILWVLYH